MLKKFATLFIFISVFALMYQLYISYGELSARLLPGVTDPAQVGGIVVRAQDNEGLGFDVKGFFREGEYTLFLPVRAQEDSLTLLVTDPEGEPLESVTHDFSEGELLVAGSIPVRVMKSDLPSVEISLVEGDLEQVEDSKDRLFRARGDMVVSCSDEDAAAFGCDTLSRSRDHDIGLRGSMGLWGHGNASWLLDKKSYDIELETVPKVLDLGNGDHWVLLANAVDYTLLRNQVFFELADECGLYYTPLMRHVDLFVDGDYRGNYLLAQKVDAGPEHVEIAPGHDFLYRWGLPGDEAYQLPGMYFRDEYTNVVELKAIGDVTQTQKALDHAFETMAAVADTGSDRYLDYVDPENWARYYWVQEFAKNTDATSRSLYTIWDGDRGRMLMSPIWDMDQTAGEVEPFNRPADYIYPTEWAVRKEEWYVPLFEHESFSQEVDRVYREGGFGEIFARCAESIPEKAARIRASAEMNFLRWDVLSEEQNNQIVRYMGESTIDTQVEWLHQWCLQRAEWIASEMEGK